MISVTRKFEFCYSHSLPLYNGKCKNNHGHNSIVEVEVCGNPPRLLSGVEYPGMVIDFATLKKIVDPIIDELDHFNLNEILPKESLPPTAENICVFIWNEIYSKIKNNYKHCKLFRVRVYETSKSYAEIKDIEPRFFLQKALSEEGVNYG